MSYRLVVSTMMGAGCNRYILHATHKIPLKWVNLAVCNPPFEKSGNRNPPKDFVCKNAKYP